MIGTEEDYAWMRERQKRVKAGIPVKRKNRPVRHGKLSTYVHHKCPCDKCKKAAHDYSSQRWQERHIRVTPEERLADKHSLTRDSLEILRDTTWKYSGAAETKRKVAS